MRDPQIDKLRLVRTEGVGPVTYRRLLGRFADATAALNALPRLARAGGRAQPPRIPSADHIWEEIARTKALGARLVFLGDPDYPPLLAMLDDAPPCLAVAGDAALLASRSVAIVGGRNASANGQKIAEMLAADLAASVTVVSGLARGIDAAAHRGALQAGRTVAVIAGGLDVPYPPEHAELQRLIARSGAVITEAPPGTEPQARHFPRRNRIIAGLSLGVVVVEAAPRSGSLITARIAQDVGREVFAVPGTPLDPRARGCNDLLRQGAVMTETAQDVLEALPEGPQNDQPFLAVHEPTDVPPIPSNRSEELADVRQEVLCLLGPAPTKVDDLVRRCQFSSSAVLAVLLELELAGRIETLAGNRIALLSNFCVLDHRTEAQ